MAFTALLTSIFELVDGATAGTGGRTTAYRTPGYRVDNCDRQNLQEHRVSNDVSALSIALSPLGLSSSTASNLLMFLFADQAVDLQFGTSGATLSAVRALTGTWSFSALFVTTGSNATRVVTGVVGGSAAAVTATLG